MAKNQKPTRDEQEKADMEKMQKRVESMLPAKADIPASISIQQAEELKARISELEAQLAQQTEEAQQKSAPVAENITPDQSGNEAKQTNQSKHPRLINNITTSETKKQPTGQTEERQKQLGLWAAGIFTAVGLAFLVYSIYTVVAVQQGRFRFIRQNPYAHVCNDVCNQHLELRAYPERSPFSWNWTPLFLGSTGPASHCRASAQGFFGCLSHIYRFPGIYHDQPDHAKDIKSMGHHSHFSHNPTCYRYRVLGSGFPCLHRHW